MEGTISVEDLLARAQSCDGQQVSVVGQFVAMYDGSVICAPREARAVTPDRPQIKIDCPDLVDRCLQAVPAYAGGPWYYHDPATLSGRFFATPEPRIAELSRLVVHRQEQDYQVDF